MSRARRTVPSVEARARPGGSVARHSPRAGAATTTAPRAAVRWSVRAGTKPGRSVRTGGSGRSGGAGGGATGRSMAASRQSSASLRRRSRAKARPSPARSPGGASARTPGSPSRVSRYAMSRPSERTSWSLCRTTSASSVAGAPRQEAQVATGDLPAVHVADPVETEELGLRGPQAGVGHPVPEQPAHGRQQVEVAGMGRRGATRHPEPGGRAAASRSRARCT